MLQLDTLRAYADAVIVDTGSGFNHVVRRFWQSAHHVLLVTTADSASIMDAYAAIKVLSPSENRAPIHILSNMGSAELAADAYGRISRACQRFLGIEPRLAGNVEVESSLDKVNANGYKPGGLHDDSSAVHMHSLANYFANLLSQSRTHGGKQNDYCNAAA